MTTHDKAEREAFEKWASDPIRAEKLPLDRWPTNDGYKDSRTYIAFYAWQTRASLDQAASAEQSDQRQVREDIPEVLADAGRLSPATEQAPPLPTPDGHIERTGEAAYTAKRIRERDAMWMAKIAAMRSEQAK